MTRPHILVVGEAAPTKGGIPTFISSVVSDPWLLERVSLEHLNTSPRSEKRAAAFTISNVGLAFRHAWQVFRRARRSDVVHLNVAPVPILPLLRTLALTLSAKAAGARVVLHAHSGRIEGHVRRPLYRFLLTFTMMVVDRFVVVSRDAERAVPFNRDKVLHVENGIDVAAIPTGPKEVDPPVLMFVGVVSERKGVMDLRNALVEIARDKAQSSLTPVRVLIVGDALQEGPGVYQRIREAYASAGLSNVEFLGIVDRDRVINLLGRASIFCLPSHWEGFPMSVLEAMAAKTAIVATAVGDIPRMLDEGRAGLLIQPGDTRALAAAITRLVGDPEERIRLGAAARARVEELFDQGPMIRSLYDLYVTTLGHPTTGT